MKPFIHQVAAGTPYDNEEDSRADINGDSVQEAIDEVGRRKLITHKRNTMGRLMVLMDPVSNTYIPLGSTIVTDRLGNPITVRGV